MANTNTTKPIDFSTVCFGDRFKHEDGDKYLLACVGVDKYCLINMTSGNRWFGVTKTLKETFGDEADKFVKIGRK